MGTETEGRGLEQSCFLSCCTQASVILCPSICPRRLKGLAMSLQHVKNKIYLKDGNPKSVKSYCQ